MADIGCLSFDDIRACLPILDAMYQQPVVQVLNQRTGKGEGMNANEDHALTLQL